MRALQIQVVGGAAGVMKRKAASANEPRPGEADFEQLQGTMLEGEVTSWKSAWGWIQSSNYTGDLFAHKEDVVSGEELSVGQHVTFTVARDEKSGRWRAKQISTEMGGLQGMDAKR